jgi:hypothetical protein
MKTTAMYNIPQNITAAVILVTPKMAEEWLRNNPNNRRKSKPAIHKLAQVICSGEWRCNGETVIIDSTGRLLDGQHRLEGIILADKPAPVVVVQGVDPEVFDTIDQGRKRTNGDVFDILGETDGGMLAAACTWVHRYQHRRMFVKTNLTPQQAQAVLNVHPDLRDSISMGRHLSNSRLCPPSVATALHYLFSKIDRDTADEFILRLADGAGLDEASPILSLRNLLAKNQMATAKLPAPYIAGMIVRGWNRWLFGQSKRGIGMKQGDSFPTIKGV